MIPKEKLIKTIKKLTNLDPLQQSRETKIVEIRSLINHVLHNYYGLGCTNISRFYKSHGKKINHATILHSLRMWEVYSKDKSCSYLNDCLHDLLDSHSSTDEIKRSYIKTKIDFVQDIPLDKVYKKVKKHYKQYIKVED